MKEEERIRLWTPYRLGKTHAANQYIAAWIRSHPGQTMIILCKDGIEQRSFTPWDEEVQRFQKQCKKSKRKKKK